MHKYWARKPHNVVGEYIEHYSKKGEIILDPFVGSGVTAIEALKRGRKAIAIDLNPIATFITKVTLKPIELREIKKTFEAIKKAISDEVNQLYFTKCPQCGNTKALTIATVWERENTSKPKEIRLYCPQCKKRKRKEPSEEDIAFLKVIEEKEVPFWYPKDKLCYENGAEFEEGTHIGLDNISDLFTKRNLIALSIVYNKIQSLEEGDIKDIFRFAFTKQVHIASRMTPVCAPSERGHWSLDSSTSFWAVHRYWIPPEYMESNVWMLFESAIKGKQGILKGKKESNKEIRHYKEAKSFDDFSKDANILILTQSTLELGNNP
jgi:adenine-specific DNA methylase